MSNYEQRSKVTGATATIAVHLAILLLLAASSLTYLDPPPQEKSLLMEFEPDELPLPEPEPVQVAAGVEPKSEAPSPKKEVKLVQRSEAQHVATKPSEAREATVGDKGDVEVPEPKREKEINQRALFSSANANSKKDTVAAATAKRISDALEAGHPEGNTAKGNTEGEPSAKLKGRTIMGSLPIPGYNVQNSGKVVVRIFVNREGTVTVAQPGFTGTTVNDKSLWDAARNAALKAKFNTSNSAPESQEGTITYIFKLK